MKFRSLVAAAIVLSMVTSAQAVQLVVMSVATHSTNSAIPAGEQVVTFGVQVNQSDLTGAGTNPVLLVQDLTFQGGSTGPVNVSGGSNQVDVQGAQSNIVDQSVQNQTAAPPFVPAVQTDLSTKNQQALYADSWWYNSATGFLQGTNDSAGDIGTLTNTAFQLGPIANVGSTGLTWTPNGAPGVQAGATAAAAVASSSGTNATNGQYMMYTGFYGPNGSNGLTGSLIASEFVNGKLTVPLAQIVTTGNINIPGDSSNAGGGVPGAVGSGTFLGVIGVGVSNGPTGNGTYSVTGGSPLVDPGLFYNFATQNLSNATTPEPGTIVLAGMGAVGLAMAWRRRRSK